MQVHHDVIRESGICEQSKVQGFLHTNGKPHSKHINMLNVKLSCPLIVGPQLLVLFWKVLDGSRRCLIEGSMLLELRIDSSQLHFFFCCLCFLTVCNVLS